MLKLKQSKIPFLNNRLYNILTKHIHTLLHIYRMVKDKTQSTHKTNTVQDLKKLEFQLALGQVALTLFDQGKY